MSSRAAPAVREEPGGEAGSLNGGSHATDRDASASWVQGGTQVSRLAVVAIAIKPSRESDDVCEQSAGLPAGHLDWQPEPMRRLPPIAKERDGGCANVNTSGGAHAMYTHATVNDGCCVRRAPRMDALRHDDQHRAPTPFPPGGSKPRIRAGVRGGKASESFNREFTACAETVGEPPWEGR